MLCSLRAIHGHSDRTPVESEFMGYVFIPRNRNRDIFHTGLSWNFQSLLEKKWFWEERKNKVRQTVFLTSTNPFEYDQEEEESHSILDTIIKSAGSRIGILTDDVTSNHDLRYDTWRMYWPCDFSTRKSMNFRKTWNSKTEKRTTPQKRMSSTGYWTIPLRTWMWIHISTTKTSARLHSWKEKLWKR